jgi:hypothetical protein
VVRPATKARPLLVTKGEVDEVVNPVAPQVAAWPPGGFEPPTSWVRFKLTRSGLPLQKSAISRELAVLRDHSARRHVAADTQGYAVAPRSSGRRKL